MRFTNISYINIDCWLGWKEFHGHCYRLFTTKKKWSDAQLEYQTHNGYLLEVESADENLWVEKKFIKPAELCEKKWHCSVWMGGRIDTTDGVYYWNHSADSFIFTNWDLYQPSGGTQSCASMWVGGKWDDSACEAAFEFICEKDLP
ncbi:perlucin-like protein [Saccostrea cucullata]|uniref:perlucin-like protein n=1 Tax=Saccostrea cuccullata TaxID=36930 RepID=UPI002ED37BCC